ncbi:gamma-aminobutyraldehyde dehydrogenase [Streptomyces chartreusis]|uniref:gamma-aminobutyraldehyde dehydrogenase n=1 Tax=Streptomyces chartreusis TaxID=1969 RepID=UPI003724A4F4
MTGQAVLGNFIGNLRLAPGSVTSELIDPRTGEPTGRAVVSDAGDVDLALRTAVDAFVTWRRSTPRDRQTALLRLADALEERAEEFADAECRDTGKPRRLVLTEEIPQCADQLRFFAGAARLLEGVAAGEYLEGHTSQIRREPLGVCAQITPWNYPLMMAVWKIGPAVAAGNTTVLKPAETTPTSTVLLAEVAAAFLPPGVVNVVLGDRDTGRALIAHPAAALVSITGSTRAGIEVARAAAAEVKQTHLELGGNAAVLVFEDADVEAAAYGIVAAGFYNAGQDCTAGTRILAHDTIHDALLDALVARAKATVTGPPPLADPDYGPLNSQAQLDRVLGLIERLPVHAVVNTGGHRVGERGFHLAPTVISGLDQRDEIVQEEIFAPVLTVQRFTREEDAVRLANDQPYGLAASVWTSNHSRVQRTSAVLDFGAVWINSHGQLAPEMPHGGFKHSGHGKDLSAYALADYTRVKHVMSATHAP